MRKFSSNKPHVALHETVLIILSLNMINIDTKWVIYKIKKWFKSEKTQIKVFLFH